MYGACIVIILYGEHALSVLGFGTDCLAVGVLKTGHSRIVALSGGISCLSLTLVATERHVFVPSLRARSVFASPQFVGTVPPGFEPVRAGMNLPFRRVLCGCVMGFCGCAFAVCAHLCPSCRCHCVSLGSCWYGICCGCCCCRAGIIWGRCTSLGRGWSGLSLIVLVAPSGVCRLSRPAGCA